MTRRRGGWITCDAFGVVACLESVVEEKVGRTLELVLDASWSTEVVGSTAFADISEKTEFAFFTCCREGGTTGVVVDVGTLVKVDRVVVGGLVGLVVGREKGVGELVQVDVIRQHVASCTYQKVKTD